MKLLTDDVQVSLPDEQHLISITHNDTAGTKLSVTAFVYAVPFS